jgi:hypothetical protein
MKPSWNRIARRWLARLAYSFVILAIFLMWEGAKALGRHGQPRNVPRVIGCFIGAGVLMALAGKGMRERHRPDDQERR